MCGRTVPLEVVFLHVKQKNVVVEVSSFFNNLSVYSNLWIEQFDVALSS